MTLVLWGRASSANVQKALWALAELGLPYDHRIVGGRYGGTDGAEFAALTPTRKVPVLQDGPLVIWDSHAILRHLGLWHAPAGHALHLATPAAMAASDSWLDFTSTVLQPPFIRLFWQLVRTPADQQSVPAQEAAKKDIAAALTELARGIDDQGRLAGADFSMADIGPGSLMYRLNDLAPDLIAADPKIAAWVARLQARPAWQAHVATSYEELRV